MSKVGVRLVIFGEIKYDDNYHGVANVYLDDFDLKQVEFSSSINTIAEAVEQNGELKVLINPNLTSVVAEVEYTRY